MLCNAARCYNQGKREVEGVYGANADWEQLVGRTKGETTVEAGHESKERAIYCTRGTAIQYR